MKQFAFSRNHRIRKSKEFHELKQNGYVFKTKKLIFNFNSGNEVCKLGIIVTKKVGNAVVRSRVKRWVREIFRVNRQKCEKPIELIIIPRTSDLSFTEIKRDFLYFVKWYNEKYSY